MNSRFWHTPSRSTRSAVSTGHIMKKSETRVAASLAFDGALFLSLQRLH